MSREVLGATGSLRFLRFCQLPSGTGHFISERLLEVLSKRRPPVATAHTDRRWQAGSQICELQVALPDAQHQAIKDFSRRHGLTTGTIMTAAFALLLRSYCDTDDITFRLTVSGRSAPVEGIENLIGLTINTVPLRVETSRDSRPSEWLVDLQKERLQRPRV